MIHNLCLLKQNHDLAIVHKKGVSSEGGEGDGQENLGVGRDRNASDRDTSACQMVWQRAQDKQAKVSAYISALTANVPWITFLLPNRLSGGFIIVTSQPIIGWPKSSFQSQSGRLTWSLISPVTSPNVTIINCWSKKRNLWLGLGQKVDRQQSTWNSIQFIRS